MIYATNFTLVQPLRGSEKSKYYNQLEYFNKEGNFYVYVS